MENNPHQTDKSLPADGAEIPEIDEALAEDRPTISDAGVSELIQ